MLPLQVRLQRSVFPAVWRGCTASRQLSSSREIGVLDLSAPGAAKHLDASFRSTGFAVVTGHGVDHGVLRDLREKSLNFFHQPLEVKQQYNKNKGYGFGGYLNQEEAAAQLLGDFNKPKDLVESLTLPGGLPLLSLEKSLSQGLGVPDVVPGFAATAASIVASMEHFRQSIDRLVAEALEVEDELILSKVEQESAGIRLAYYPAQTTPPLPGQMRYGEHIDSGGITILIRDERAPWGTQVRMSSGEWLDVPIVPESIVLNVGALLARWSNGRWRASIHRVANDAAERLSIVTTAVNVRHDAEILPLSSCISESNPSRYEPVLASDFLTERVRLHRSNYAEERGMTSDQAEQNLRRQIENYQM